MPGKARGDGSGARGSGSLRTGCRGISSPRGVRDRIPCRVPWSPWMMPCGHFVTEPDIRARPEQRIIQREKSADAGWVIVVPVVRAWVDGLMCLQKGARMSRGRGTRSPDRRSTWLTLANAPGDRPAGLAAARRYAVGQASQTVVIRTVPGPPRRVGPPGAPGSMTAAGPWAGRRPVPSG